MTRRLRQARRLGLRLTGRLTLLAASMRAAGARVGVGELLAAHRALAAVDPADRERRLLRAARRAVLAPRRPRGLRRRLRGVVRRRRCRKRPSCPRSSRVAALVLPRVAVPPSAVAASGRAGRPRSVPAAWSDAELLREKDFADYTDAERALARRVMRRLAAAGPARPSRRTRRARRRGAPPPRRASRPAPHDPLVAAHRRRSLRAPLARARRAPAAARARLRRVRLDGALRAHAAPVHAGLRRRAPARRGVRLRHAAHARDGASSPAAIPTARSTAPPARPHDWSGGTRIGDALATLNREHGRRLGRGAIVVLLSDGWDRGEPEQLAAEMARLRRCAHRLVWLNPLKAHPGYEPLTRGMQAALPHVDHFLAGNSLASLAELAELMEGGLR